MRTHAIAPTPKHYEIWYAYHGGEKPALSERIDSLLQSTTAITSGLLDELHRECFATEVVADIVRDGSNELHQLATEMGTRVNADRIAVEKLSTVLSDWALSGRQDAGRENQASTAAALSDATARTGEQLGALEQLFAASLIRINDLSQKLDQAQRDASFDALTGLANRRNFDASLHAAIEHANRSGAPLTLLMVDIDHFKRFNDTYGHQVGDLVLRLVGLMLKRQIKGRDIAARYGGEEFAVILPETALAGAITVGDQLRHTLEQRPIVNRQTSQRLGVVTCSVGVAAFAPGMLAADLIERADQALYQAKRSGRNRVIADGTIDAGTA